MTGVAPRKRWGGHDGLAARAEALKAGPSTLQELFRWPTHVASNLTGEELNRLKMNIKDGALVISDYSGIDAFRETIEVGIASINHQEKWDMPPTFKFVRACDRARAPQEVLATVSKLYDKNQSCLFTNIEDRLVQQAQDFIAAATPAEDADLDAAKKSMQDLTKWLMDNRQWIFKGSSHCVIHNRQCSTGYTSRYCHRSSASTGGTLGEATMQPLKLHTSGMTCTGWSAVRNPEWHLCCGAAVECREQRRGHFLRRVHEQVPRPGEIGGSP